MLNERPHINAQFTTFNTPHSELAYECDFRAFFMRTNIQLLQTNLK